MVPAPPEHTDPPPSPRTTLRRAAHRAVYDPSEILAVIREAPYCHVGVSTLDGPLVLPMSHGCDGEHLFLHGAHANSVLGAALEGDLCATFTLVDGLVFGRTAFHNSVNYRSAVVRGRGERLEGDLKVAALRHISDHVVATWDEGRPPTDAEIRATLVVAVPLAEASAKVRTGDPSDETEDLEGPWWAGTVPVWLTFGQPLPAANVRSGTPVPPAMLALADRADRPGGGGRTG